MSNSKQLKYRSVLLFGPPGAGKGTLGRVLSFAGNHVHLSSGDIFRSLSSESPIGKVYHSYAKTGHLVPDDVTLQIWHHYVEGLIATNRYFPRQQLLLLDGIPRTKQQAEMLDEYVDVLAVIVLEASTTDELMQRMKKRAHIEKRADDINEEIVKTRHQIYQETTQQLLQHYPSSKVVRVNALQKPLEVLRDVLTELHSTLSL